MNLKPEFELVEVAGEHMAIPVGSETALFQGVVALSESAFFLLKHMDTAKTKEEMINLLIEEYEVDPDTARKDLDGLLKTLFELGIIEE